MSREKNDAHEPISQLWDISEEADIRDRSRSRKEQKQLHTPHHVDAAETDSVRNDLAPQATKLSDLALSQADTSFIQPHASDTLKNSCNDDNDMSKAVGSDEGRLPFAALNPSCTSFDSQLLPDVTHDPNTLSSNPAATYTLHNSHQQRHARKMQCCNEVQQQRSSSFTSNPSNNNNNKHRLVFHKNLDDDGIGIKAILEGATSSAIVHTITSALRTVLFISFPLFTLGVHPKTMYKLGFPKMLMASVLSTSCSRSALGPHIGLMSWTWSGMIFALITGTIFNAMHLTDHLGTWWGMLGAGIFVTSLIGHRMLRQFYQMFYFFVLLEMRMFQTYTDTIPLTNTAHLIGLLMMGSMFGVASNLLPRPSLVAPVVDSQIGRLYTGLGAMVSAAHTHIWASPIVSVVNSSGADDDGGNYKHDVALFFFSDLSQLEQIETALSAMPASLWGCNWEPLEFPLRNPIRRLKLSLIRRIMAMMYAAYGAGRTVAQLRCASAERTAMTQMRRDMVHRGQRLRREMDSGVDNNMDGNEDSDEVDMGGTFSANLALHAMHSGGRKTRTNTDVGNADITGDCTKSGQDRDAGGGSGIDNAHSISAEDESASFAKAMLGNDEGDRQSTDLHKGSTDGDDLLARIHAEHTALGENSGVYVSRLMDQLQTSLTALGAARCTPAAILQAVPFAALAESDTLMRRNMRLEMVQRLRHVDLITKYLHDEGKSDQLATSDANGNTINKGNGNASDDITFKQKPSFHAKFSALHHLKDEAVRQTAMRILKDDEVVITLYTMFFYVLMSLIVAELISFGERMRNYRPTVSLRRRLWNYFVREPWRDFCDELTHRLRLARPCDVRCVKDAFRVTIAYLVACALNLQLYVDPEGLYFFGTTLLLGLPVEEEALNMGINRIAGNVLGSALGYFAYHNTASLSAAIGCIMVFVFVCQCCKEHPMFGQTFFYASIICMVGMINSQMPMQVLTRVLYGTYTVMAYMICCMLIFPNSPIKVLWNYRIKLSTAMSELIDEVVAVVQLPITEAGFTAVTQERMREGSRVWDEESGVGVENDANEPESMLQRLHQSAAVSRALPGVHGHAQHNTKNKTARKNEKHNTNARKTNEDQQKDYSFPHSRSSNADCDDDDDDASEDVQKPPPVQTHRRVSELHLLRQSFFTTLAQPPTLGVAERCARLHIRTELVRRLLGLCGKWTPFASRESLLRGMAPFPSDASAAVHTAHQRMVAKLQLLTFSVQLIHRPRQDGQRASCKTNTQATTNPIDAATASTNDMYRTGMAFHTVRYAVGNARKAVHHAAAMYSHSPTQTTINPQVCRLLRGPVSDFLRTFADVFRVLMQDYTDSLQQSRVWSYATFLAHMSRMRRMRVRLNAVSYEVYITLGMCRVGGIAPAVLPMGALEHLRDERDATGAAANSNSTAIHTSGDANADAALKSQIHMSYGTGTQYTCKCKDGNNCVDDDDGNADNKNNKNNNSSTIAHTRDENANESILASMHGSFAAPNPNRSFAGRFLQARLDAAERWEEERHFLSPSPPPPQQQQQQEQQNSGAAAAVNEQGMSRSFSRFHTDAHLLLQQSSPPRELPDRRRFIFQHAASLREEVAEPEHGFAMSAAPDAAEELVKQLRRDRENNNRAGEEENMILTAPATSPLAATTKSTSLCIGGAELMRTHRNELAGPDTINNGTNDDNTNYNNERDSSEAIEDKSATAVQMLDTSAAQPVRAPRRATVIVVADKSYTHEAVNPKDNVNATTEAAATVSNANKFYASHSKHIELPMCTGPEFSYREDIVDLPLDTDDVALMTLLASCHGIADELLSMSAAINEVSKFQKQLHESTTALSLITRWSDRMKEIKKRNFERTHYADAGRPKNSPYHAQMILFEEWQV